MNVLGTNVEKYFQTDFLKLNKTFTDTHTNIYIKRHVCLLKFLPLIYIYICTNNHKSQIILGKCQLNFIKTS